MAALSVDGVGALLSARAPGAVVVLSIRRGEATREVSVTPAARPDDATTTW